MKKVTELRSRNLRQDRNSELVRRMRNGDSLTSFNSQSSWFPPRPTIEKDPNAIHQLYGRASNSTKHESSHLDLVVDRSEEQQITLQRAE